MFGFLSSPFKYTRFTRPLLIFYYFCMLFLSLASSTSCFHRLPFALCKMPKQNESTETVGGAQASDEVTDQSFSSPGIRKLVKHVFGHFKDYLSTQVDVK